MFSLRGGWSCAARSARDFVSFDPDDYCRYAVATPGGPVPFAPRTSLSDLFGASVTLTTPTFQRSMRPSSAVRARWRSSPRRGGTGDARQRQRRAVGPTESIRLDGSATLLAITQGRRRLRVRATVIPRLKVEYQPTRALFFRVVTEYQSQRQAALRDPTTGCRS